MAPVQKPMQFLRDLQARGAAIVRQNGSHVRVRYGDRFSTVPVHNRDMKVGTGKAILRQLGIDDWL